MSEVERRDVIQRLRRYADRLQELMDSISDRTSLTPGEKTRAQSQMKVIKV